MYNKDWNPHTKLMFYRDNILGVRHGEFSTSLPFFNSEEVYELIRGERWTWPLKNRLGISIWKG